MCVRVCVCVCVCVCSCVYERERIERERESWSFRAVVPIAVMRIRCSVRLRNLRDERVCVSLFFSFLFFSLVFEYVLLYCTVIWFHERAERHMSTNRTQASERKKEYAILSGCHVGCFNTVDVRAVTENSQKNFNF